MTLFETLLILPVVILCIYIIINVNIETNREHKATLKWCNQLDQWHQAGITQEKFKEIRDRGGYY